MRDAESALERARRAAGARACTSRSTTSAPATRRWPTSSGCPVEALKIDRSFIEGVGVRKDSTAIVGAVVGLARALRLSTVAEGIETREQFQQLRAMGCEVGQGFLFGPARPPEVFGPDPRPRVRPSPPPRRGPARPAGGGQPSHRRVTEPPRNT